MKQPLREVNQNSPAVASLVPLDDAVYEAVLEPAGISVTCLRKEQILSGGVPQEDLCSIGVLICRDRDVDLPLLNALPSLAFMYIISAGAEHLPFAILNQRGVQAANVGDISANAISDYVLGAILLYNCKFLESIHNQSRQYWKPYLYTEVLAGKNLLIVGTGNIGRHIAKKAKAFDLMVTGICRTVRPIEFFDSAHTIEALDDLLPLADYVVCALPLTSQTEGLFHIDRFARMKPEGIFINVSRGRIVAENAMESALDQGLLAGAVLDVFSEEPLGASSALWKREDAVITPHSSGRIQDFLVRAMEVFAENYNAFRKGNPLPNAMDLSRGY